MKGTKFVNAMSRSFHKVGFQLKKHSPEILIVAGVAGTVASAVLACKATLKVHEVLDETKANVEEIHDSVARGYTASGLTYNEEDSKKDLTIVYTQTGVKLAKLYAPAVIIGAVSIAGILASNNIMRKRNLALAAAYATVDNGFKEYRSRVVDRFGKELDRELKYNIKAKEVQETVVAEDGTESTVTKTVKTAEVHKESDYARFFDEYCTGWTKDPEYNLMFLRRQQDFANKRLQTQGYLYLNDVYEMLGMDQSKAGHVVGWIYDEENPIGDNYVDFGIYDVLNEQKRNFVNGRERSVLIDFNVDGNIWELMK